MQAAATLFKALGNKTRLGMIWLLLDHRELCVCDFMELLGISQSTASRHLRALFHVELVRDRRQGQWVYYTLRKDHTGLIKATLDAIRMSLTYNPEAVVLRQALTAAQLGLYLPRGVGPLVVDTLIADLVVDVELILADVTADVHDLVQLGHGR